MSNQSYRIISGIFEGFLSSRDCLYFSISLPFPAALMVLRELSNRLAHTLCPAYRLLSRSENKVSQIG